MSVDMSLPRPEGRLDGAGGPPFDARVECIADKRIVVRVRGTARSGRVANFVVTVTLSAQVHDSSSPIIEDESALVEQVHSEVEVIAEGCIPGTDGPLEPHALIAHAEPGWGPDRDTLAIRVDSDLDPCFWAKVVVPGDIVRLARLGGLAG